MPPIGLSGNTLAHTRGYSGRGPFHPKGVPCRWFTSELWRPPTRGRSEPCRGDGHCLYHALGWWDGNPQGEVRRTIAAISVAEWRDICPWDDGTALAGFQEETLNPRAWGGALQIAAMARIRGVAVLVHTDFGLQVFGQGPSWQIRHTINPAHYDVIEPDPVTDGTGDCRRGKAAPALDKSQDDDTTGNSKGDPSREEGPTIEEDKGGAPLRGRPVINKQKGNHPRGQNETKILTINIGGSKEALGNALQMDAHILLIQEHRLIGPTSPGRKPLRPRPGGTEYWTKPLKLSPKGAVGAPLSWSGGHLSSTEGPRSSGPRSRRSPGPDATISMWVVSPVRTKVTPQEGKRTTGSSLSCKPTSRP